jgi:hypothetical protein
VVVRFDEVVGSWSGLMDRLEARGVWSAWSAEETALQVVSGPAELPGVLTRGHDRATGDGVLGALVRLAAVDGGGDTDAALLVLHLLGNGIWTLADNIAYRTRDSLAVVVGELTCQIRGFPWRRRNRSYAANLLLNTKNALWRGEFRPVGDASRPDDAELVDPTTGFTGDTDRDDRDWPSGERNRHTARISAAVTVMDRHDGNDLDLADLFTWAAARGVAAVEDLSLLWESELRVEGGGTRVQVAAAHELGDRRERRRRHKTLTSLRNCRGAYLAAVA